MYINGSTKWVSEREGDVERGGASAAAWRRGLRSVGTMVSWLCIAMAPRRGCLQCRGDGLAATRHMDSKGLWRGVGCGSVALQRQQRWM